MTGSYSNVICGNNRCQNVDFKVFEVNNEWFLICNKCGQVTKMSELKKHMEEEIEELVNVTNKGVR